MAELEYKGIKLGGSKLILILPLIGGLASGGWAVFDFYSKYKIMETKINKFVSPDLSEITNSITELNGETDTLKEVVREQVNSIKDIVGKLQTDLYDMKLELKQDLNNIGDRVDTQLDKQTNIIDNQDTRNRNNVQIVRDIISAFETRIDNKVSRLDIKLDTVEANMDERIKMALTNPLNR